MQKQVTKNQALSNTHLTLKERAEKYDGELNLSEEVLWGEAAGDEVRDEEKTR